MPERDTYKAIERYAKNNNDPAATLGYLFLKRRTELSILWELEKTGADIQTALNVYLGTKKPPSTRRSKLADMSEEERLKEYMAACNSIGIKLDPAAFKK